jgi:16S rRNA (uracil1498-N3)-methyltransferase
LADVSSCGRDWVEFQIVSSQSVDREISGELTVAIALPKGDRQHFLIEKLVELGVCRLVPLTVERSSVSFGPNVRARLTRYVIEASKQCGRNRLMEIDEAMSVDEYFPRERSSTKLIAQPDTEMVSPERWARQIAIAVGPEGGFTADELQSAWAAGWMAVGLGPRILRVETAAMMLSSLASAQLSAADQSSLPTPRSQTT